MNKIQLKTNPEDIINLRKSGKILAKVIKETAKQIRPGISTWELDQFAFDMIKELGGEPAFLNYKPRGAEIPFPATLCISVNEEIVHGIPKRDKIIKDGDIVCLDGGVKYKGMITDHAVSVICGEAKAEDEKLLQITKEAMMTGIKAARAGNYVSDISKAIENTIPKNYGIVRELSGHGVGYQVHEAPYIPNYYMGKRGELLQEGLVIAIEPMVNLGGDDIELLEDGYTIVTADGKKSGHFEHTILITSNGPEIITVE